MPIELHETRSLISTVRSVASLERFLAGFDHLPSSPLSFYIRINSFSKGSTTVVVQEDGDTTNTLKLSFSALSQAG
jgi:hypothetical protein